jgi:hypothetical protein
MSDQSQNPTNSPSPSSTESPAEAPAPTLRETIEAAYDAPEGPDAGQDDRARDSYGRFVAKDRVEPGEAEAPQKAPSPEKPIIETAQKKPTEPAAATVASSTQPPEHWSAEDKATFAKMPPEGQSFLLKRHTEMEADYTRKSQAASGAVQFAQSLSPVFNDPVVMGSLKQEGIDPAQAIHQWAAFHKRAISQDQRERISLLVDLSQRMGLDPARLFVSNQSPPPNLSKEDMNDPAIRYFADHAARTQSEVNALKQTLQQMQANEAKSRDQETLDATLQSIDQFADEKDAGGRPLRPHFNAVLPEIIELFRADPERDMQDAYERAIWSNKDIRSQLLAAQHAQQGSQANLDRAKAAARGNTRGITSPVAKPNAKVGNGTLRDLLEATADEVGLN